MNAPHTPKYDDKALYALLEQHNIAYKLHKHEKVDTVEAAMQHTGNMDGFHIKNLFLRDKKRNFYLITVHFEREINLKNLGKEIGAKGNLSFASADILYHYLGVRPGSVSPFGLLNDEAREVRFFLDKAAPRDDGLINPHPLRSDFTLQMKGQDLIALITMLGYEITDV